MFATKVTRSKPNPLFEDPLFRRFFGDKLRQPTYRRENSLGSGVIVDENGYILTNNHVIRGASEVQVVLRDGRHFPARIVGTDPETDLAVLQAAGSHLPVAALGRSDQLRVGDVVMAIGNPFGVGQTVTLGIVSATGRDQLGIAAIENFIQTDAAINPGNSGGALINARGEVVGINTAIFSESGGSHGIGFAIPVRIARTVLEQITKHGRVIRGWIGVNGQEVTPALAESFHFRYRKGLLISGVLEGGPADRAGIQPGDLLVSIDGQPVVSAAQALDLIAGHAPGEQLTLGIERDGRLLEVETTVAERPPQKG
ncbi:S1C family serine protease [endosymbiont of unidentified scaly snail isolate Monju]|uniref:S1C family serine protease n=1 Tax=endosymbiont of unidentified scaly snail isolate Monju TaxID=1248727 RepID=UPI0003891F2F|nr:serine protease DegS [endosymbiont of unidentified scaly snail isolate Monju]